MTCTEARELILDADPAQLRGEGDADLARHVAGCPACAAEARVLQGAMRGLDVALASMAAQPASTRVRRARPKPTVIPLGLAAAALIAVVLYPRASHREAPGEQYRAVATRLPRGVEVDLATSPRTVAVFTTADPTITVVWYF